MVESKKLLFENLGSLRIADLKAIIDLVNAKYDYKISSRGRKNELVDRLSQEIPRFIEKHDKADSRHVIEFMNLVSNKKWVLFKGSIHLWVNLSPAEQELISREENLAHSGHPPNVTGALDEPWQKRRKLQDIHSRQDQPPPPPPTSQQLLQQQQQQQQQQLQLQRLQRQQSQNTYILPSTQAPIQDSRALFHPNINRDFPSPHAPEIAPRFTVKPNSFYQHIVSLTAPVSCPVTENARGSRHFNFKLSPQQTQQIKQPREYDGRTIYQVRVFCVAAPSSFEESKDVTIEFPSMCELRVNGHIIEGSTLRGLKNKPGTVHAPDVTPWIKPEYTNKIELLFANTAKRYLASVEFVQRNTVNNLVKDLLATRTMAKNEVLENFQSQNKDTDIVITHATLTTRCPVRRRRKTELDPLNYFLIIIHCIQIAFSRIKVPCRGIACMHLQCYDATTFLSMNEQTPTWICPVCSRTMTSYKDLVIDGHFTDILARVDEDVESVQIDANGEMQIEQNTSESVVEPKVVPQSKLKEDGPSNSSSVVLDTDTDEDYDDSQSKPSTYTPSRTVSNVALDNYQDRRTGSLEHGETSTSQAFFIDLTTDSEDEDDEYKKKIIAN
ncbi:PINIT domain-containing protein [Phycomyces nitens]|nr:PINIT domain-containing protein [Phycomyces nitens]